NGSACAPREIAASRHAARWLTAARSPVWGELDESTRSRIAELTKDLCLFNEHTWGAGMSVAQPYSLDAQGQFNEKARLAWRPMALAEWLLGQRARTRFVREGEGLWLANAAPAPFSGWVNLVTSCLRADYRSVVDSASENAASLRFSAGPLWGRPRTPEDLGPEDVSATFPDRVPNRFARFWVDRLDAHSARRFRLSTNVVSDSLPAEVPAAPVVEKDGRGWPVAATWPGMKRPLFARGVGDIVTVKVDAFAPRWALHDIWNTADPAGRRALQQEKLGFVEATTASDVEVEDTPHTLRFDQWMRHPRLKWARRTLEIRKREARARLVVRFDRFSSFDPELVCVVNPLPCDGVLPRLSSGGLGFTPFGDQLPGTCRDYFAIDGWANYATPEGHWFWVSRDAPLVTLDGPHPKSRLLDPPARTGRMLAIVFDNFWYTNFQGDSPGVMEFQFEFLWRPDALDDDSAARLAEAASLDPVVVINPALPEDPIFMDRLYKP
ncbi:MAG: hypothetical protein JNL97_01535, partial [Verrucomicrobiales bacterium]|nr:hypothetical protein [Verrucomicrobiales bacterium]